MSDDNRRLVLTVEEAAALLRISRGLAYQLVRTGDIPSLRLGRRLLIPTHALERMVAEIPSHPDGRS